MSDQESKEKICPLLMMTPAHFGKQNSNCCGEECGWWCDWCQKCALVTIGGEISGIK